MITPADKAELIEKLKDCREQLFSVLERLTEDEAAGPRFRASANGEQELRSINQELALLGLAEAAYRSWIVRVRADHRLDVSRDPPASEEEQGPESRPLRVLMQRLRGERRLTMTLLAELEPHDFSRTVRTATGGVTVEELFEALCQHDRELTMAIIGPDATFLPGLLLGWRRLGLRP